MDYPFDKALESGDQCGRASHHDAVAVQLRSNEYFPGFNWKETHFSEK